jgi:hypothetical protein
MKSVGICLLTIAGLTIWGLLAHWHFDAWQDFDWIIIIFNVIAGIYLISQADGQNNNQTNQND